MMLKPSSSPYTFFEAKISLQLRIYMDVKAIPCTDSWKAVIFYKSTNFDFPLLVSLRQLHVFVVKVGNHKANYLIEKYASRFFQRPKASSKKVCVTTCASLYSDTANFLSGDIGSSTKLVGVKTSPSHKVLSRRLNVVRLTRIFSENFSSLFSLGPLLFSNVLVSSGSPRLSVFIPQNSHYSSNVVDDVLIIFFFHKMSCSFQQTFVEESPLSCIQPHTVFNKKIQCNVFLPHVIITRRQFQRLKYSVCPSIFTDDLVFSRKNRLIIATCCLYCRTNRLRRTNRLKPLVRFSRNTAIEH